MTFQRRGFNLHNHFLILVFTRTSVSFWLFLNLHSDRLIAAPAFSSHALYTPSSRNHMQYLPTLIFTFAGSRSVQLSVVSRPHLL